MKQTNLMKKGFTLVEVVIVLAIAALIMVVVFFAVTGAQRSQRNQTRKDVANRVKAAMVTARGNTNGAALGTGSTLDGYVPAAERGQITTITVATAAPTTCAAAGTNTVTAVFGTPDIAYACLEGGVLYQTQ